VTLVGDQDAPDANLVCECRTRHDGRASLTECHERLTVERENALVLVEFAVHAGRFLEQAFVCPRERLVIVYRVENPATLRAPVVVGVGSRSTRQTRQSEKSRCCLHTRLSGLV
jgi:hypothetical protein